MSETHDKNLKRFILNVRGSKRALPCRGDNRLPIIQFYFNIFFHKKYTFDSILSKNHKRLEFHLKILPIRAI